MASWRRSLRQTAERDLATLAAIASSILLASAGFAAGWLRGALFVIGILAGLAALAAYLTGLRHDGKVQASAEERLLRVASTDIDRCLQAMGANLPISGSWRISIYVLRGRTWMLLARTADLPHFADLGRGAIGPEEGVLRRLLLQGFSRPEVAMDYAGPFPDRTEEPGPWVDAQVADWGLEPEVAAKLRMPSRTYVGAATKLAHTTGHGQVLGVVVESTAKDGVSKERLQAALNRSFFEVLYGLLSIHMASNDSAPVDRAISTQEKTAHGPDSIPRAVRL